MNMRKIIAVLAAVLMLCAAIPMAAISVSAAAKLDNNFDDGTVGKFKCDSVDTIVNEDGVMKWTTQGWKNLYASFSVSTNADYKVTFKMKAAAATAMEVKYLNGSWGESGIAKDTINVGTEWTEYSRILNSGSNNGLVLLFQSHKATDVYIDDVKVVDYVAPAAPEIPDDAIYFEDFETDHTWASGNANASFEVIAAGDAPAAKAENGNYVVKHTIPESVYPYISDRTGISVQPNTDYIISFDALNSSANWPIQVIVAENYWLGGAFALSLSQQIKPSNTTWETYSFVFNTGDHDKIWLGAKSQWANTTVYFDNFYIAPLNGSVQNDGYLKNGNFEAGSLEWLHTSNTEITADDTGAGMGNVITTNELASGAHMFSQPATNLVVDHEYVLSFKVYGRAASNGNSAFWVQFPSAFTTWSVDTTLGSAKYNNYTPRINVTTNVGAWHTVNITFTAKAETAVINFLNYRANQGFYSFDDIVITPKHNWNAATCTAPKTCSTCGLTEGEALGHTPGAAADCDSAQVCTVCGAELAAALGHDWADATCTAPKTCSVCGATDGDALGHTPGAAADCDSAQVCTVCGAELAAALGHTWADATCTAPKTCTVCGATEGDALGHTYDNDCDADCNVCGTAREVADHVYADAFDTTCDVCGAVRAVVAPAVAQGFSCSEDVRGLAVRFEVPVTGMGIDVTTAIYDNAYVNGYKLISMGAIANNGVSQKDIPAVYLCNDDVSTSAKFAIRIINIPEGKEDVQVTFTPYVIVEIDGEQVTIYGEAKTNSYGAILG